MIKQYATLEEKNGEIYFNHIGLNPKYAHYFGVSDKDKIYEIVLEPHEDQSEPNWNDIDYWGWLDYEDNEYKIIWPNYKLFHCCFPYGVDAEEKSGKGKSVRLKLVSYEKYNQMD